MSQWSQFCFFFWDIALWRREKCLNLMAFPGRNHSLEHNQMITWHPADGLNKKHLSSGRTWRPDTMPKLFIQDHAIAIGHLQAGRSQVEVAQPFNVSQPAVSHLWAKFQETGAVVDKPKTRRPRVNKIIICYSGSAEVTFHIYTSQKGSLYS